MEDKSESRLESRRLQKIKGGSYTITLPKWWIDIAGIKKGSEVLAAKDGLSLKLFPKTAAQAASSVEVYRENLPDLRALRYAIWTYYMQGAEKIIVRSKSVMSPEEKRGLRAIRLELQGIEVIDEGPNSITFGVTIEAGKFILDEHISRMAAFAADIHKDALEALTEGKWDLADEVVERGVEILRHYRAMVRQIALCSINPEVAFRSGVKDSRELITYALLARDLSRTVYHAIYIGRHLQSIKPNRPDPPITRLLKQASELAMEMHRLAIDAFIEKDFNKAIGVIPLMDKVREVERKVNLKVIETIKDIEVAVALIMIAREIRRIAGYSVAMADVAANRILTPYKAN